MSYDAQSVRATSDSALRALLIEIWTDALEKPVTDPEATFFDNDGDSMGATIVIISIQERLQVEITIEEFFDDPSVPGLMRAVRASAARSAA